MPHNPLRLLAMCLALFVCMLVAAVFNENGILTVFRFEEELEALKIRNMELKSENAELEREIEALKGDAFAIEKIARERLNLVKPGETIYRLVRQEGAHHNFP